MEKNKNKGNIIKSMGNKAIIVFLQELDSLALLSAGDFTPQGNITLRNVYNIQNATSLTIGNGSVSVLVNSSGFFGNKYIFNYNNIPMRRFYTGDRIWLVAQELDSSGKVLTSLNKNVVITRLGN